MPPYCIRRHLLETLEQHSNVGNELRCSFVLTAQIVSFLEYLLRSFQLVAAHRLAHTLNKHRQQTILSFVSGCWKNEKPRLSLRACCCDPTCNTLYPARQAKALWACHPGRARWSWGLRHRVVRDLRQVGSEMQNFRICQKIWALNIAEHTAGRAQCTGHMSVCSRATVGFGHFPFTLRAMRRIFRINNPCKISINFFSQWSI